MRRTELLAMVASALMPDFRRLAGLMQMLRILRHEIVSVAREDARAFRTLWRMCIEHQERTTNRIIGRRQRRLMERYMERRLIT